MSAVRILIVEDEPFIAQDLALRLERAGFVITDIVDTGAKALAAVRTDVPDLVLLDIRIKGDMDGIATGAQLAAHTEIPFIYLTAHADETTVARARHTRPAAYLLKPFNDRRIKIAIDLAVFNRSQQSANDETVMDIPSPAVNGAVFIKNKGQYHKLRLAELRYVAADGNYSTLVTAEGKLVLTCSIGLLLERLQCPDLVRIHRSYAVHLEHIDRFEETRLFVDTAALPISRSHRPELLRRLNTL